MIRERRASMSSLLRDYRTHQGKAALAGKYRGKIVDLYTNAPENSQDPEAGGGFQIRPSAKK